MLCIYVCTHVCVHVCMHACDAREYAYTVHTVYVMRVGMCVYVYMYTHACRCMEQVYAHVCVYHACVLT